jgi:uncharacterized phage protein (TIGR01671 family)
MNKEDNYSGVRNRVIKFKVWFHGIKVMGRVTNLKGSNTQEDFDGVVAECFIDSRQQFYEAYQNFTLLQFSGLHDKNGVEIFDKDLIRIKGKMGNVGEYAFDAIYCVHLSTTSGISIRFARLTNQEPDSRENSYPICQSGYFERHLNTDYRNHAYDRLVMTDHYYDDSSRNRHQDHHYTNDIEVIGNIYSNPELIS